MANLVLTHDDIILYPGGKRYVISANAKNDPDLLAAVTVTVKAGGLREDSKPVDGQDGVERTFLGYEDAEVTVNIRIWNLNFLDDARGLASILRNKRGSTPQAMQIVHPATARWGITEVYLYGITENPYTSKGGMQLELQFREFQPVTTRRTKAADKIKGASGGAGGGISIDQPTGVDVTAPSRGGAKP